MNANDNQLEIIMEKVPFSILLNILNLTTIEKFKTYVNKTIKSKRYNQRWGGQFSPDLLQFQSKSQWICKFWNCVRAKESKLFLKYGNFPYKT